MGVVVMKKQEWINRNLFFKKMAIFVFVFACYFFSWNTLVKADGDKVEAQLAYPSIIFKNNIFNLKYDALLYNGYTYISIRDIVDMFSKQLLYDEESGEMAILTPKADEIIKDIDTAEKIGKVIVEEHFKSKINNNTKYHIYELECDCLDSQKKYVLDVIFDYVGEGEPDYTEFDKYKDVSVYINSVTGGIEIEESEIQN